MILKTTPLEGVLVVEPEPKRDERGLFARTFDTDAFARAGVAFAITQTSVAYNTTRGTLRGLHFQRDPHAESKLVRCTRGAAWDVVVDLRAGSATRGTWHAVELSAESRLGVFVPPGCAHGYLTLANATELTYAIDEPYAPGAADGVRWDDPAFGIEWPERPVVISPRDASYADFAS